MSVVQTFELEKGRVFVSGLFWQPLPSVSASQRKTEIEKIAREQRFDLIVLRTTGVPQAGFAPEQGGVRRGMYSAAAIISKTIEVEGRDRSMLCATEISINRWLYVAQREGVVLPDGDFIGTEDQIRSRMLTDLSIGDWETMFAPDHWGISNATERSFRSFLPTKGDKIQYKSWWMLAPVRRTLKSYIPMVAISAAVLLAMFGYSQYRKYQDAQELKRYLEQQAAEQNALDQSKSSARLPQPWATQARATEFAKSCDTAMDGIKTLWSVSWTLNQIACSGGALTVSWVKSDTGRVSEMQLIEPRAVISMEGNQATLTVPVPTLITEEEAIVELHDRILDMHKAREQLGYQMTLSAAPPPAPTLPGDKSTAPQPHWQEIRWTLKGKALSPVYAAQAMEGPGLRVSGITTTWNQGEMNWTMEGIQYVKP